MNTMTKLSGLMVVIAALLMTSVSYAESYYRWKDENGVMHYGSRPPSGVDAVEIKAHGGESTRKSASKSTEGNDDQASSSATDTKKVVAERQKQCEQEKQRLSTLQSTGRIRMTMEDGSTRYLSPEEVAKEMQMSQEFISEACK